MNVEAIVNAADSRPLAGGATGAANAVANITRVSFIDVGKGDCILIQTGKAAALIDTGYEKTAGSVLSYLLNRGVERLECVIITHYDKDHIGGIRTIGRRLPIDMVYLPGYKGADKNYLTLMQAIGDLGLPTRSVSDGLPLRLGDSLLALFPSHVAYMPDARGDEGNDNDLSLAASIAIGEDSFLFTGDMEEDGIASFRSGNHGRFDVLKMPCHGKKSPLTDELLDDTQPQIVVITDSADDPADKKTLKMLEKAGAAVYRTSIHGTIVVESNGSGSYSVSYGR